MKKKKIIILICIFIILVSSTVVLANISTNQTKHEQYKKDFDSFTPKKDFKNRDEVIAEIIRLNKTAKLALETHSNDEYGKQVLKKKDTIEQQLEIELSKFPEAPLDLDKEVEDQYKFFSDALSREDPSLSTDEYNNSKYALDEAQSIYNQYKNKSISTQQAYDRIMKIKFTDRQNGIKN